MDFHELFSGIAFAIAYEESPWRGTYCLRDMMQYHPGFMRRVNQLYYGG